MAGDMVIVRGREDSPVVLMAHVLGTNGAGITRAGVSTLSYSVFQYDTLEDCEAEKGATEIGSASSLTVAQCVFDELQTGNGWTADDEGYNVKFTLPGAKLATPGKWFRVEVWLTDSASVSYLAALYAIEARPVAKS